VEGSLRECGDEMESQRRMDGWKYHEWIESGVVGVAGMHGRPVWWK